jgi:site-specific recombinase XerC
MTKARIAAAADVGLRLWVSIVDRPRGLRLLLLSRPCPGRSHRSTTRIVTAHNARRPAAKSLKSPTREPAICAAEITTAAAREWLNSLLRKGLSPATVKTYRQILGQVLNQAVADGLLLTNPVEGVKTPTVRPRRQMFLTADELAMLAEAAGK